MKKFPSDNFISHAPGYWEKNSTQWNDHVWQLKNSIKTLAQIETHLTLAKEERAGILLTGTKLAMGITPHFFNLIEADNPNCPIRRQMIPRIEETWENPHETSDPLDEDKHMPVPGLVHRYPDRVLFLVTDRCASYCRYCTRSRIVSGVSDQQLDTQWEAAFTYIEKNTQIRDVLLSGGDPLLLSDSRLEKILSRLHKIKHLQFLRIGTRIPIFLPQRITDKLCQMLQKYPPLWISIHSNHPRELTLEVKHALEKLANHGIPLGNQSVLLKHVNDDPETMRVLLHKLLQCRVRPYYLYQCDQVKGSAHLRAPVQKGIDIIQSLRGHTTGYALPQFVIDAPGGGGKIPINPETIVRKNDHELLLRNYEGKLFLYPEPEPQAPTKSLCSCKES